MKKLFCLLGTGLTMLISACSLQHNTSLGGTKSSLHQKKLASGDTVTLGMVKPTPAWGCLLLATQPYKWSMMQLEGTLNISGGYGELENKAIDYANKNNIKTNYIYYTIPSTNAVNGINVTAITNNDQAQVFFYRCQRITP